MLKLVASLRNLGDMNSNGGDKSIKNAQYKRKGMIDDEFKKHKQDMEWLLTRLVTEMDVAAQEVSKLMNDTFSRFKRSPML